jgi:D-inositol-3-phosphate glycosyltransferase
VVESQSHLGAAAKHREPRRIAMISVHTSPLEQPGTGDAGGMNVYVTEVARQLAQRGVEVDVFTRATSSDQPPTVELVPGVSVRHVTAGPFQGLRKEDLPGQLCAVTAGVLRAEAARPEGWYDVVGSHYWLSGQVGWLVADRWNVPLVHAMHTLAKVKNLSLAAGDTPEPAGRVIGEQQVVDVADRLIANTSDEVDQLINLYNADPAKAAVVHPGVDLELFTPGDRLEVRARLGLPTNAQILLFAGRIQPLKGPDVLVRAAAQLVQDDPSLRSRLLVAIVGGPSGSGLTHPDALEKLAIDLGVRELVRFIPPASRPGLADWFRAADLTVIPSYSESFGLVAVESQACGTPVVAARVGGLTTAVADGRSGILVDGHNPRQWAIVLAELLAHPAHRDQLAAGAREHAASFGWDATADRTLEVMADAMFQRAAVTHSR